MCDAKMPANTLYSLPIFRALIMLNI
jgi:hypothetical protein